MLLFINQVYVGGRNMAKNKTVYRFFNIIPISLFIMLIVLGKNGNVGISSEKNSLVDKKKLIPILMYHHVGKEGVEVNKITITNKRFEEDMKYLKDNRYTPIFFNELVSYEENGTSLPEKPVIITFDDGLEDNYKYAYPVLRKNNMKATIFTIGSRIGIRNFNNDTRYSYFTWKEGKEMYESGIVEIQPHSYDLHNYKENSKHGVGVLPMSREDEDLHYDRFSKDTVQVMKLIKENIGCDSYVYAYPYGKYNSTNERVLKDLNFKVTLTTKSKYADISNGLYELKRINVPSHKKLNQLLINQK